MLGILNDNQIEDVLKRGIIGRIGCYSDGVTYVVPVTYVYDGEYLYGHTTEGMKITMMRNNPEVCFEVDEMQNMSNWQSVIAWGNFEEVTDAEAKHKAMQKLIERVMPLMTSETAQPTHGLTMHAKDTGYKQTVVYRIKVNKKTGRFEKR
ncbi:MAG: pyridoxamine 5'-phosphate oxidase family protein [Chitinophagaceae bacterium]|nr:pyridoxamine 5'-phosphate oxidase family protein [Chitinophagaceae bacterium]